jgi:hypothetical protein
MRCLQVGERRSGGLAVIGETTLTGQLEVGSGPLSTRSEVSAARTWRVLRVRGRRRWGQAHGRSSATCDAYRWARRQKWGQACGDWGDDAWDSSEVGSRAYRLAQVVGEPDPGGVRSVLGRPRWGFCLSPARQCDAYRWAKTRRGGGQACGDWRDDATQDEVSSRALSVARWPATDLGGAVRARTGHPGGQAAGHGEATELQDDLSVSGDTSVRGGLESVPETDLGALRGDHWR